MPARPIVSTRGITFVVIFPGRTFLSDFILKVQSVSRLIALPFTNKVEFILVFASCTYPSVLSWLVFVRK